MNNFWKEFKEPVVGLSPMDGVTDAPMRYITAKYGHAASYASRRAGYPSVIYTEFVSADGLVKAKDKTKLLSMFKFDEIERPIVAQIFGSDPEVFCEASKMVAKLGFDGIDINMGCPAKKVEQRGSGAGLIKTPKLAGEIIEAVNKGVEGKIPVSVKTRIGYSDSDLSWIEFLASQKIFCLAVHGRTFKQGYSGKADWESIALASQIAKKAGVFFLGNGDVSGRIDGIKKCKKYSVDGVLIGRRAIGNPWVFAEKEPSVSEKMRVMREHAEKFEEIFPEAPFFAMRKHLAAYCSGFSYSKKMRMELMQCNSSLDVKAVVEKFGGDCFGD